MALIMHVDTALVLTVALLFLALCILAADKLVTILCYAIFIVIYYACSLMVGRLEIAGLVIGIVYAGFFSSFIIILLV